MNHVRGLLCSLISRECPSGCKLLQPATHQATWLGAVATLLWSVAMTKRGCIGLCAPFIVVSGWSVSLFGFGNLVLHFFDLPFLSGTQESRLCHQAPGLGIPKGRLVLWFESLHLTPSGGSLGFIFECSPHPNGGALSAVRAQCARSATIWASGRTRDPYFEILGAPRGIMVTPSGGLTSDFVPLCLGIPENAGVT